MNKKYDKNDTRFKYTSKQLIKQVQENAKKVGGIPKSTSFKNRNAMLNRFGETWGDVLIASGIMPEKKYTKEELLEQIREKTKELGKVPACRYFEHKNAFISQFGSYGNAVIQAGFTPRNITRTDEELLESIRILSEKICDTPTVRNYYSEYGSETVITKRFGSWNKALVLAGLTARKTTGKRKGLKRNRIISDEELILIVQQEAERFGRTPKASDMNKYISIIIKRFGKWSKFIALAGLKCRYKV